MFSVSNKYARVWRVFSPRSEEAKYLRLSISTSEKNQAGEWVNSNWTAVAVGHAYRQIQAGEIKEGSTYSVSGKITNVGYKDENGGYHDNCLLTIFDFGNAGADADRNSSVASKQNPRRQTTQRRESGGKSSREYVSHGSGEEDKLNDLPW